MPIPTALTYHCSKHSPLESDTVKAQWAAIKQIISHDLNHTLMSMAQALWKGCKVIWNENIAIYMKVIILWFKWVFLYLICEWFLYNLGTKSKREKEK